MSRDRPRTESREEDDRTAYERRGYSDEDSSSLSRYMPFGWPTWLSSGRADETRAGGPYGEPYEENRYGDRYDDEYAGRERYDEEEDGTWIDEGLITLTILAGVVLFLIPEPATSGLGILLIGVGVVAWLLDWALG